MRTLPPRLLREIRGHLAGAWDEENSQSVNQCIGAIDRALRANTTRRKRLVARKEPKRAVRREKTAAVREACMKRSGPLCENCKLGGLAGRLEMDHFFGGSKRRALESVETCWMLCQFCHFAKTNNSPSAEFWRRRWADHCKRQAAQEVI